MTTCVWYVSQTGPWAPSGVGTQQLAGVKTIKRLIQELIAPYLQEGGAYGPNQFAYTRRRGARDALAAIVLTWAAGFSNGFNMKF